MLLGLFSWFPGLHKRHQALLCGEDPTNSQILPGTSRWGQNHITYLLVSYRPQSGELKKHQLLWLWKTLWKTFLTPSRTGPEGRNNSVILLLAQHGKWGTASLTPSSREKEKRKSTTWTRMGAEKDTAAKSNTSQILEQSTRLNTNEPCWFYDLHNEDYQGISSRLHTTYKYSIQAFTKPWQF